MKVTIKAEINPTDGTAPLFEDVQKAIRDRIPHILLRWADPSLGRYVESYIDIDEISEG